MKHLRDFVRCAWDSLCNTGTRPSHSASRGDLRRLNRRRPLLEVLEDRTLLSGDSFVELTKLTASDAAAFDFFGSSVAVSADGGTVVVGSVAGDDAGVISGSAYVYHWDGSSFTETKLTASDAATGDQFGGSVAVSADGGTVVVGSVFDDDAGADSGSAYVYHWDGSSFTETKLTASDAATGDRFGFSVAVSADGGTVVVGSFLDDVGAFDTGSAYVYRWVGSSFTETKLTASDAALRDRFGISVAISADGGTVVVGSFLDDDGGSNSGSAYVYHWDGSSFTETKLTASDAAADDRFGERVALSADGGTVVVGSPGDDDAGSGSGSAYVYEKNGSSFTESKLTASDAAFSDGFGISVAVSADGGTVVVGSQGDDDAGSDSGSAYVYEWNGSSFTETKLTASDAAAGDNFGISVAVSADGGTLVVASTFDDDAGTTSGSAYVFVASDTNEPPSANAGGPYVGVEGSPFQLNGTGSSDPDDVFADLTFEWDLNYDDVTFDVDATGAQPTVSFADDVATRTIALRVTDPDGLAHVATTTLTVNNALPTVTGPVVAGTNEDAATLVVDLLAGASDLGTLDVLNVANLTLTGGDAGGVSVVGNSLSINPGAYNHLAAGQNQVITYSYNVVDDDGGIVAQTATITIEGRNDAPSGAGFSKTGTEDSPVSFATADFAAGFADPDNGDTLVEVRIDSLSADGALLLNGVAVTAGQVISAAGLDNLVFVPALNFNGATSFTFSVGDGMAFSNSATVTLDFLSAAEQADLIFGKIQDLLAAGVINEGQAESLNFLLKDNNGDAGKVQAFLNEVQGYINGGILTEEQAHDLLVCGELLLHSLTTG